ncbi:MAG TPA: acetoacetate decarboxylase family protein [Polyangiales bacterium]
MTANDPFFDVPHRPHPTSLGNVELPIDYYDNSHCVALFTVAAGPVREKLAMHGFAPALAGGKAQLALVFFEYAHTAIGPYNEVGLASLAVPRGQPQPSLSLFQMFRNPRARRVGTFVHNLPVTAEAAKVAGRELWGYPKFVTQLPITWGGRHFRGAVMDPTDGSTIVELAGKRGVGMPVPAPGILAYSKLGSTLLQAPVDVRGRAIAAPGGSLRVRVGSSQHEMAQNLRDFELEGAKPDLVLIARHARSLLYAGEPIALPRSA